MPNLNFILLSKYMKKSTKKSMKKSMKKSYTKKRRNFLKGGVFSRIGTSYPQPKNKTVEDKFENLVNTNQNTFAYFHYTNLENVFTYPNNDENFSYHSLFISYIDHNINDLDVVKWSINNFLNNLLTKLNNTTNTDNINNIIYAIEDLKINDFKFEFNIDKNAIILSGHVYITNINKQINKKLNTLNKDFTSTIKQVKEEIID